MVILKRIIAYVFWTIIAILAAFCYMRIILGAKPESSTGLGHFFDIFYEYVFFHIGAMMGLVTAFLFILIDVFYLNKRLKNIKISMLIRFLIVILITIIIGTTHYVLEKVV